MHCYVDPPAVCCYSTSFLSVTRRLLSSRDELAREVQANISPLGRFLSLSGLASSQPKQTEWTEERLRSSLDQARRVRVRRNDLTEDFQEIRDDPDLEKYNMSQWKYHQNAQELRHYWGQALCCNYDWDWDLSESLKRLFRRLNADDPDDSTPLSSTPEELVTGSSSSACRFEYENVLEYREINRHARRKIEAWLNDGWSVEWEWYGRTFGSGHYMTLRRLASDDGLPFFPSPSNKRIVLEFPTTPNQPSPYYGR